MAAMNSVDAAVAVMKADIASRRATKRSLGVVYAMIMAGNPCTEADFWRPINTAILDGLQGQYDRAQRLRYLDGVKKVAWEIYETVARSAEEARAA